MTQPHAETPQPTSEEIFQRASELHQGGNDTNGGMRHLLLAHEYKLRRSSFSERRMLLKANTMGRRLEKKDPETNEIIDKTMATKSAVVLGATAGLLILGDFYKDLFYNKDMLNDIRFDPYTPDEKLLSTLISHYGDIGLYMLGPRTENLLSEWRQFIFTDYDKRQLFSHTVGLVTLGASNSRDISNEQIRERISEERDRAEFEATFNRTPEEIDEELAELLKGQP